MRRRSGTLRRAFVLGALLLGAAAAAQAHTRSQSFSNWEIAGDGTVRASFSVLAREATRLVPLEAAASNLEAVFVAHLARRVEVHSTDGVCVPVGGPRPLRAREGHLRAEWHFDCPPGSDLEIGIASFFDVSPSHVHFARVRRGDALPREYLYTDATRSHPLAATETAESSSTATTFTQYVSLGVEHIWAGFDHIAFLLALLLLSSRLRDVAWMVTGFTLGHSLTLTLAALGWVVPDVPVIEALIGFTIALVAIESVAVESGHARPIAAALALGLLALAGATMLGLTRLPVEVSLGLALFGYCSLRLASTREAARRFSPVLTVVFGLVHGFGFASVLMEIGLPRDRLVPALFGFNIGVEVGQLVIVAGAFTGVTLLARHLSLQMRSLGRSLLAAGLCGLGLYWFVLRATLA
ncbi:MAG: HupE/UreJ family protein [Myxococcota bacterium]